MRLLSTILFLSLYTAASATNYYVSNSGNDANAGTSSGAAWQTIAKVNSFFSSLSPGDSVLFKRGETFAGGLVISRSGSSGSPIVIGAYGTGAKPVISGLTNLSGWSNVGTNLWEATLNSGSRCSMVLRDSIALSPGRYPNANAALGGYLQVDACSPSSDGITFGSTVTITDASGTNGASNAWVGGEIAVRNNPYTFDRAIITASTSTTISWGAVSQFHASVGFGYFIQNHPVTLDQQNEWYYNPVAHTLRMYSTTSPTNVSASTVQDLIDANNKSYVNLQDLRFVGADSSVLHVYGASHHIMMKRCDMIYNGTEAITTHDYESCNNITIDSCFFNYTYSYTVLQFNADNMTFTNNIVKNTGLKPGLGVAGSGGYGGVGINGHDNLFQYNRVDSSGGVCLGGAGYNITMDKNYANYYAYIYDDVGAYYFHNSGPGNKFTNNFALNGYGGYLGTDGTGPQKANAFYIDEDENGALVQGNFGMNGYGSGIYNHSSHGTIMRGNTLVNFPNAAISIRNDDQDGRQRGYNNKIYGNILYSKSISNPLVYIVDYDHIGLSTVLNGADSNIYLRPFNPAGYILTDTQSVIQFYNTTGMNGQFGYDAHGVTATSVPRYTGITAGSNTFSNSSFNSSITGVTSSNGSTASDGNTLVVLDTKLDGNAVKTSSSSSITTDLNTLVNLGGMTNGHTYRITFSSIGSVNKANLRILFMEGVYSGYFGENYNVPLGTSRTENTVYVTANSNKSAARMVLEVRSTAMPYWIDNVVVQDMTAFTTTNIDDSIRVEYNDTKVAKVVSLGGNYRDMYGAPYTSSITLQPFTSSVLHKENNASPVASAGIDQTITLPTASVSLNGSLSSDPEGSILAYQWTQVSGPNTGTFSASTSQTTNFSGLVAGLYTVQLIVMDNAGFVGYDTLTVTVNPAVNIPPVANAGTDKAITLPTSSVVMTGSGTDADGTVTTYAWTQISGPNSAVFSSTAIATPTVSGLIAGTYVLRLTVTDNNGATSTDNVSVAVSPAPNAPPTANAGFDIVITSPTNTVSLAGIGTDTDGTIASYAWAKISGPGYAINNAAVANPVLSLLVEGRYVFRLTVVDNNGASATDDVIIDVLPASVDQMRLGGRVQFKDAIP